MSSHESSSSATEECIFSRPGQGWTGGNLWDGYIIPSPHFYGPNGMWNLSDWTIFVSFKKNVFFRCACKIWMGDYVGYFVVIFGYFSKTCVCKMCIPRVSESRLAIFYLVGWTGHCWVFWVNINQPTRPSKHTKNWWERSTMLLMGIHPLCLYMAIFNSFLYVYQRVIPTYTCWFCSSSPAVAAWWIS